jgi:hypothetical protein
MRRAIATRGKLTALIGLVLLGMLEQALIARLPLSMWPATWLINTLFMMATTLSVWGMYQLRPATLGAGLVAVLPALLRVAVLHTLVDTQRRHSGSILIVLPFVTIAVTITLLLLQRRRERKLNHD